jgi:hypothetical protein
MIECASLVCSDGALRQAVYCMIETWISSPGECSMVKIKNRMHWVIRIHSLERNDTNLCKRIVAGA